MAFRLYIETLQEGSRFTRAGKGTFGLVDCRPAGIKAQVQRIRSGEHCHILRFLLDFMPGVCYTI